MPQVDRLKANQVVPGGEVVVPDHRRRGSLVPIENLHVSVRLGEVVAPQPLGSDHHHVHAGHSGLSRAAVGVDHAVSFAPTCTVLVLVADLAARRAAERLSTFTDVVADGIMETGLQDGVVLHLQNRRHGVHLESGMWIPKSPSCR